MTNRPLRKALLEKLKVTQQALSQRVQKLKKSYAITTEDATYLIAQWEGIILDKYLDRATVNHIRGIIQQITHVTQTTTVAKLAHKGKRASDKRQTVIVFPKEFTVTDPILEEKKLLEAKDMATVYPLLYVLENSIREIIDLVMSSRYGDNWWDSEAPKGLRDTVTNRMANEKRDSWHQRRGARPIDYLDLNQLPTLMRKIEREVVPDIISSLEWFTQLVEEVYKSRCVVCHMNPLDKDNVQGVKLRFRQWQKLINAKRDLIPSAK
ncbi:hypothetical protein ES703_85173 [subsurface metagenome]